MKTTRLALCLVLALSAAFSFAAENAAEPVRKPLLTTGLGGIEVAFVRDMATTSLLLQHLATGAKATIPAGEMADFASSLSSSLDEQLANLALLAREQGIRLPTEPTAAQTAGLGEFAEKGLTGSQFLAEVLKVRSEQLKIIQKVGATRSESIRNFAGAMVKTIQDDLIFIQLISSRAPKPAAEPSPAAPAK